MSESRTHRQGEDPSEPDSRMAHRDTTSPDPVIQQTGATPLLVMAPALPQLPPGRLPQLDSLRGLVALAVVLAHFDPHPLKAAPGSLTAESFRLLHSIALGNAAVAFFFVLSAFLLTKLACTEHLATGRFSLRHFYIRRCLRIWPLYFVVVAVAFILASQGHHLPQRFSTAPGLWSWLWPHAWIYLLFLSNWSLALMEVGGHIDPSPGSLRILWSIAVEEQFYLLHPLILLLALGRPVVRRWLVLAVIASAWGFRLWFVRLPLAHPIVPPFWGGMYYATFTYLDIFLAGGIAGWLAANPTERSVRLLRIPGLGPGLIALCLLCCRFWNQHLWYPYSALSVAIYSVIAVLFATLLLWFAWNPTHLLTRLLCLRPLHLLGLVSYGMYLWHVLADWTLNATVFAWLDRLSLGVEFRIWLRLLLVVLGTVGLAALSYAVIERPFLRLKSHFSRIPPRLAGGSAAALPAGDRGNTAS